TVTDSNVTVNQVGGLPVESYQRSYPLISATRIVGEFTNVAGPFGTTGAYTGEIRGIEGEFRIFRRPQANLLMPGVGSSDGQQLVSIFGEGFSGFQVSPVAAINFGDTPAPYFRVDSDTTIEVLVPAHIVGDVPVSIVWNDGDSVTVTDPETGDPIL